MKKILQKKYVLPPESWRGATMSPFFEDCACSEEGVTTSNERGSQSQRLGRFYP